MNTHPTTLKPHPDFDLTAQFNDTLAKFTEGLAQTRIWRLVSRGGNDAVGYFDAETGLRYPTAAELTAFLNQHPFLYLKSQDSNDVLATLHTQTSLFWAPLKRYKESAEKMEWAKRIFGDMLQSALQIGDILQTSFGGKKIDVDAEKFVNDLFNPETLTLDQGKTLVKASRVAGLSGWRLPTKDRLWAFATAANNPHREGQEYRLHGADYWLTAGGCCDVDNGHWWVNSSGSGYVFAYNPLWQNKAEEARLVDLIERRWRFTTPNGSARFPQLDTRWQGLDHTALMLALRTEGLTLVSLDGKTRLDPDPFFYLYDLDYTPCRLPRLEPVQLTDPNKGLWELWGNPPDVLKRFNLVARDPQRDVKHHNVAIDFGTSSTVVAYTDERGGRELLRVGVRDYYQAAHAADFENPTVLEFIDFKQLLDVWNTHAYRPPLDWNWVHAAHEAQASFRDNPGDTRVLASILPRLKQWELRSEKEAVLVTDRQGHEMPLAALSERNPVRGTPMQVSTADPFDPIELYAWFLGMAINWRGRGLHLKYHMTFPVKYDREVKNKILASFRRGLQRSLPPTLVQQPGVLDGFEVVEIASEPAAYAAAALRHLGVEPTPEGVPYAVFDFGGGTTDFDFGIWRQATPEEEADEDCYEVFEHLHSGGDNFLGGENLLEHLVYATFRHNLDECRTHKISFTRPLDGERFTGDEAFVQRTQVAQTNTVLLAARLRPFLESPDGALDAQLKIDLLDVNGEKQACEFSLDRDALDQLLATRIERGVRAFLAELAQVQDDFPAGELVHVLLAGNGSRSRHVTRLFDAQSETFRQLVGETFGDNPPELVIHPPLPMDEKHHHAPTAKTGVALGLLALCPGEHVKLIDHVRSRHADEAPFRYFVGREGRDRKLDPRLTPESPYQQWVAIGKLQQGVFKLVFTTSPRARAGLPLGDPELRIARIDFPAAQAGDQLFARPTGPTTVELAAAPDQEALADRSSLPRQMLDLEKMG